MGDSLKIQRESLNAWWCPVDDHANAQSSDVCGGCKAVRDGDKVVPRSKSDTAGGDAGLQAEVTELKAKLDAAELVAAGALSYDDLSPEALEVECDKKGVEAKGTGAGGNVLKKDRVAALEQARKGD